MPILIVGFSTRALAESAVRSGYPIVTLDYFGDRDQRAWVENLSLLRDFHLPFSAKNLAEASRRLSADALVYTSSLENDPALLQDMSRGRRLLGNSPALLCRVRDWCTLRAVCREEGVPIPTTLLPGEEDEASQGLRWLRKPVRGGGGRGIGFWKGGVLDDDHLLQAYVEGEAASVAFVADGQRSVVLGITEQLIGREELGAGGFTWCGNILPLAVAVAEPDRFLRQIEDMVCRLTRRFGLRGVNGIDFVVGRSSDGCPYPMLVEVNPRYTGSMELVERAYGLNVFSLHVDAMAGLLPDFSLPERLRSKGRSFGKAIVYARQEVSMPETGGWEKRGRRDIPYPGERIEPGHPICTVLGAGDGRGECFADLLARANAVRREIGDETGGTPWMKDMC